jgi:hypothetical protein
LKKRTKKLLFPAASLFLVVPRYVPLRENKSLSLLFFRKEEFALLSCPLQVFLG